MDDFASVCHTTSRFDSSSETNSIECGIEVSKRAEYQIQPRLLLLQLGDIENAKEYLKKAFEIDSTLRLQTLDDEDLKNLWDSL